MEFETGNRVQLRHEALFPLQPGVEPGAKGTVGVDDRQHAHTVIEGRMEERLITVIFDRFTSADLVEESALEGI